MIREEEIEKAVRFLTSDAVVGQTDDVKMDYLRRKGLAPDEIEEALSRAAAPPLPPANPNPIIATVKGTIASTKNWLFILLLTLSSMAYHYRAKLRVLSCVCVLMILTNICRHS